MLNIIVSLYAETTIAIMIIKCNSLVNSKSVFSVMELLSVSLLATTSPTDDSAVTVNWYTVSGTRPVMLRKVSLFPVLNTSGAARLTVLRLCPIIS